MKNISIEMYYELLFEVDIIIYQVDFEIFDDDEFFELQLIEIIIIIVEVVIELKWGH